MTRNIGPKVLSSFAAFLLVLTACGGSSSENDSANNDGGASVSEPSDADSTPDTSAVQEVDPADQAIAEAALLTLQDFPAGWEAAPASDESDGDGREGNEKTAACVGVEYDELYGGGSATANSPDFTSEDDAEVSVSVVVARDEERMTSLFGIASGPRFRECLAESTTEEFEKLLEESAEDLEGVEVGDLSLNELSFGSYGDGTAAFRMTLPVAAQGFSLDAKIEFVQVRVGRARTLVTAFGFGSAGLTTTELTAYVELAVQRLEDALAESA